MIPPPVYHGGRLRVAVGCRRDPQAGEGRGAAAHGSRPAYVYALQSRRTGRFYLGWTTDLQRRPAQHNAGVGGWTRARGPWELLAYEVHATAEAAKRRERSLKQHHRMGLFFIKRALTAPRGSVLGGPKQVGG